MERLNMTRGPAKRGLWPILFQSGLFPKVFGILFLYACYYWIFSIFGRYWAFLEPKFWEEVGDEQPTSNLYKPGLFEAMKSSHSRVMLRRSQAKAILLQGRF
jgi:hypothetical protein